jgi:hypothetical protein
MNNSPVIEVNFETKIWNAVKWTLELHGWRACALHPFYNNDVFRTARDTLLSNQKTEKLNFDTNYITILFIHSQDTLLFTVTVLYI